ncbi:MAG: alpha-glucuronidase family glycosyl hydrolase, partial [Desulfobacteraceae bacterium]
MKSFYCKLILILWAVFIFHSNATLALPGQTCVLSKPEPDSFPLIENCTPVDIHIDNSDFKGVIRAATDLRADIKSVTGIEPNIIHSTETLKSRAVFIGTIGKSPVIDELILNGKLDVSEINGKWESFIIQVITDPVPNVKKGLVIAGSDKRGSIYGCYDLSEQIGVSPWYWWADVPAKKKEALYVK